MTSDAPLHVALYRGFGNASRCELEGRVLARHQPTDPAPRHVWDALRHSYLRFETDEVPDVAVRADVAGAQLLTTTDEEGYFRFDFDTPPERSGNVFNVPVSLPTRHAEHEPVHALIQVPPDDAAFGVISDIDDTVMLTRATSLVQMLSLTLLGSPGSRVAFDGVAAFYSALHADRNPFFYVSSSPWNLYEFLEDFFELRGIVAGPLLLRDLGITRDQFIAGSHHQHKLAQIRRVLDCYPTLPFVLVGDSGQADPEIYADVVATYPGRIRAVYIRDVSADARDREVQRCRQRVASHGVDMLLVPDTRAAASHAASMGLIDPSSLVSIDDDARADMETAAALEAL